MLEIKAYFGEWKEATKEQAEHFYNTFCECATALKGDEKRKHFNKCHIRGGHVLMNGTVETTEEQKERVFQSYKKDLLKVKETSGNEGIRFNVIEYVCSFPKINPFVMAASIINEGITILFDDSSISKEENRRKERQVKKLLA